MKRLAGISEQRGARPGQEPLGWEIQETDRIRNLSCQLRRVSPKGGKGEDEFSLEPVLCKGPEVTLLYLPVSS